MSADFSRAFAAINDGIEDHIRRDGLTGVRAAVFRDRGGHAPGERCPTEPPHEPLHAMTCELLGELGEACTCGTGKTTR